MDNILFLLSGLSESGKSHVGEYLGSKGRARRIKFVRVVLHYELLERPDMNPYERILDLSQEQISCLFCENFQFIFYKPQEVSVYVIESVMSPIATTYIKKQLGDKFNVCSLYLDASLSKRIERQIAKFNQEGLKLDEESARNLVVSRDKKKITLGADKIKEIADIVLNNEGDLEDLHATLDSIYNNMVKA